MMHNTLQPAIEKTEGRVHDARMVLLRLWSIMAPSHKLVAGAMILILINATSQGVAPYLIGRIVDQFINQADRAGLGRTILLLIGVYLAGMLATRFQILWMSIAGQRALADLRQQVFERIQSLSLQFLEGQQAGDLMSRVVNDIDTLNSFLSQGLTQMIGALFALLGIIIGMLSVSTPLGIVALLIVPVMLWATRYFSGLARSAFRKTRMTIGSVSAGLEEDLGGIKVTQAYNRTELNVQRFSEKNAANRDANVNANAVTAAFAPAMDLLSTLDTAIVASVGGWMAIQGVITVGVVISFLQYVQNFFRPIQTVSQLWATAQSAFAGAERVFNLLDNDSTIRDVPEAIALHIERGEVAFQDVTFSYDGKQNVLKHVSFLAKAGQITAIVGQTGAGKTTLISLIPRFYEPSDGRILIDGVDIHTMTQNSIRLHIGMVTQEPFLFSGTIMDNIRYGRLNATDVEVKQAAETAYADDFISRLSGGYATEVGERGKLLSQGQRQLITIARAILADPRILILDEATASIDTQTEALIQRALKRLMIGRTSFVIAHRLSTVRYADHILVLQAGEIVESGKHEELMLMRGVYAGLQQYQLEPIKETTDLRGNGLEVIAADNV